MPKSHEWILGVAASHNGAACLLEDGKIVVAVQEERVTRHKRAFIEGHRDSFAIRYCLDHAGIAPADLAAAVICSPLGPEASKLERNPFLELDRHGVPLWSIPHHLGHAVAAFATSGFSDAAVLVVDGMGSAWRDLPADERAAALRLDHHTDEAVLCEHASLYQAERTNVVPLEKHIGPVGAIVKWFEENPNDGVPPYESLGGIFNSAAVRIFGQFHEAGKVMGLAPFGRPTVPVSDFFVIENGTFRFVQNALPPWDGALLAGSRRAEAETLAASAQAAVEAGVLHLVRRLRARSSSTNLVYAGGVALNSITNERIVREGGFRDVYIMPAAEDSGTAIGAAYFGAWKLDAGRRGRRLDRDSVGRPYEPAEIERAIDAAPAVVRAPDGAWLPRVVDLLAAGKIVGWFEGGSELGPRALGQRSLLCDPRPPTMKDHLNARVKHREGFRPFAPMVLLEEAATWFDLPEGSGGSQTESPFMLRICDVREERRALVPAVVHVDGTARLQTITPESHPNLHALIRAFQVVTGVPILLNTSFNVAGEPIVETAEDALWCLVYTGVDALVLEGRVVTKRAGYESILDLQVRRGPVDIVDARADRADVRVPTRYGPRIETVSLDTVELLERTSAAVGGHHLLAQLVAAHPSAGWDAQRLVRRLGALRRAGLLTFTDGGS